MLERYSIWLALITLLLASYYDVKKRVIPNWITLGASLLGVILLIIGWNKVNFFILIPTIFLLLLGGYINFIGMGDVKLLIALSVLTSPYIMMLTLCLGALSSIIFYYFNKEKRQEIKVGLIKIINLKDFTLEGTKIPFAPFLTIGYILTIILEQVSG